MAATSAFWVGVMVLAHLVTTETELGNGTRETDSGDPVRTIVGSMFTDCPNLTAQGEVWAAIPCKIGADTMQRDS